MQEHATRTGGTAAGHRTPWMIMIVIAAVVALAVAGAWAVVGDDGESDPQETATELVDRWSEAWMDNDLDRARSVFTDDGMFVSPTGENITMEELPEFFEEYAPEFVDVQRTSDLSMRTDGVYSWTGEMQDLEGVWLLTTGVIELDGELASRIVTGVTVPLDE